MFEVFVLQDQALGGGCHGGCLIQLSEIDDESVSKIAVRFSLSSKATTSGGGLSSMQRQD
jgi:hypothetical protein